jgi:hypothetical protein
MILLLHADLHDPTARGINHLLLGGGRVLWIGTERPELPAALGVDGVTTVVGLLGTDDATRHPRELVTAVHACATTGSRRGAGPRVSHPAGHAHGDACAATSRM